MAKHLKLIESDRESLTMAFLNPEGQTMTPALVNAIRRVMLAETESISLGLDHNRMIINTSAFNTDYIRDRLALLPVHQKRPNTIDSEYLQNGGSVFRICDPDDWSKPLKNPGPDPLKVKVNQHLLALKKKSPQHDNLRFTTKQLIFDPDLVPISEPDETKPTESAPQKESDASKKSEATPKKQEGGAKDIPPESNDDTFQYDDDETTKVEPDADADEPDADADADADADENENDNDNDNDNDTTGMNEFDSESGDEIAKSSGDEMAPTEALEGDQTEVGSPEEKEEKDEKATILTQEPGIPLGPELRTHEDWTEYYEKVDVEDLIKYDFYLLLLKSGEEILQNIIATRGTGQKHSTYIPAISAGYYFVDQKQPPTSNKQVRPTKPGQYTRATKYTQYPAQINLKLEYNGHYLPRVTFKSSLEKLQTKIQGFRKDVIEIKDHAPEMAKKVLVVEEPKVFDLTERHAQAFTEEQKANFLVLKVKDEDSTLGQLVATYGAMFFQNLYRQNGRSRDEQVELMRHSFAGYRCPSPLDMEVEIRIKTPEAPVWPANQPFNDAYSTLVRPVQVLVTILDEIDNYLSELLKDTETVFD